MKHRTQVVNFRTSEFPLSASVIPFLLQPRFTSFDIGELFDFVAATLWSLTGVRTNKVDFSLVNLTCPFNGFSHGSCKSPNVSTWPSGKALLLTFAISDVQEYDPQKAPSNLSFNSNYASRWSYTEGLKDFVTISVSQVQAHEWGLTNLQEFQLFNIYNLIGAMTKSVIRRQSSYIMSENYEEVHAGLNLVDMHDRYFRMSIKQLFTHVPISMWCFNRELWQRAPQVLMQRLITPQVALFYFMYLADDQRVSSNKFGNVLLKRLGLLSKDSGGICDVLESSVFNLIEQISSPSDSVFTSGELIAPLVLIRQLESGSSQIQDFSRDYMHEFTDRALGLIRRNASEHISAALLLPAGRTARMLMNRNVGETRAFINDLKRTL